MNIELQTNGTYDLRFYDGEPDRHDLIGKGWVARLTGLHPKYRYEREFCPRCQDDDVWMGLIEGGIYQYRSIYRGGSKYSYEKYGGASGFFRIADGTMVELQEREARTELEQSVKEAS